MHNISGIKALPHYMHSGRFANWPIWGRGGGQEGAHRGSRDRAFSSTSNTGNSSDNNDEVRLWDIFHKT